MVNYSVKNVQNDLRCGQRYKSYEDLRVGVFESTCPRHFIGGVAQLVEQREAKNASCFVPVV